MIHRPWVVILGLARPDRQSPPVAPRWEQVTKDDDVRFFPPDSLSVIGQDLLERGFPADASSSQLVLVYERRHGHVTPAICATSNKLPQVFTNLPSLPLNWG